MASAVDPPVTAPAASSGVESLAQLKEVFPLVDSDTLLNVIQCTNGNMEQAISWLLEEPLEHPAGSPGQAAGVQHPGHAAEHPRPIEQAVELPRPNVGAWPPEHPTQLSRPEEGFSGACAPAQSQIESPTLPLAHLSSAPSSQGASREFQSTVSTPQDAHRELQSQLPSPHDPHSGLGSSQHVEEATGKVLGTERGAHSPTAAKRTTRTASADNAPGDVHSPGKRKLGRSLSDVHSPAKRKLGKSSSTATSPGEASSAKKRATKERVEASLVESADHLKFPLDKVSAPLACSATGAAAFAWASLKTKTALQTSSFGPDPGSTWLWFLVCELQAKHKDVPAGGGITEVRIVGDKFQAGWVADPSKTIGANTLLKHHGSMLQSALEGTLNEYGSHRRGVPEGFAHSWTYSDSVWNLGEAKWPVSGVTWTEVKRKDRWRVDVHMQWHTARCINYAKEGRYLFVAEQRAEKLNPNQYATAMRGAMTHITSDVEGRDALLRTIQLYHEKVASKTCKGKGQECLTKWVKRADSEPPRGSSSASQASPEKQ